MLRTNFKVLLVEDVITIAKVVEQMLKKSRNCAYSFVHKTTLAESVAALRAEDFDIVLLDLNLPDSRELETLSGITDAAPAVPVIVLTATNSDEIGRQAVQCGAQDFLVKGECSNISLDRSIIYSIERHRLQRTLRQLAVLDELTGLYNRRGFNTLHPDYLQRARSCDQRGFMCTFDLDRFKQINDQQGHAKGDEALVEFAGVLRSSFRKDGLFARLGGDEFVAMGLETHPGQAVEMLRGMHDLLAARNTGGLSTFRLESSAGVVYFDRAQILSIEELSAAADADLYRNKQQRRLARQQADPSAAALEERR